METLSMGNLPRISVVIVTYNFAKYLRECIDSILAQTLRPCEIVIYDDCSTDESWSIITEYSRKHPGLFVVHRQPRNVGMHVNANTALQRATGDLVSCLDGDDRWLPRKLELEWAAMCRNPEAKIAYSNVYTINAAGQRTAVWHDGKSPQPPSGDVFVQVFSKRFFPGIRSIFRNPLLYRFVLEQMDYHDESVELYINWDLKIRLTAFYQLAYSGEALVDYRIHPKGIHNQPRDTHLRDLLAIYRKNLPLLAQRTAAEIELIESELGSLSREYGGNFESAMRPRPGADADTGSPSTDTGLGENLVFLVSLPRSGSTLLQRVLANHPDVHTTAEPWVMLHPLYALKQQGFDAEYESDLARRALHEFLGAMPDGEGAYIDALRAMASVLYGKVLQSSGKRLFLDKTPRYYYILPELLRVFPKARFVLLSRNPVAVLSSLLRTWLGNDLLALEKDQHYVDLVKGPQLLSQGMGVLGESAITVHYEDLVCDAAETVQRICDHVGIPFQPAMLDYGRMPVPTGTFGDPASVHRHNTVVADYLETWRSHLGDVRFRDFTLDYIDSLGGTVFETLGYSSDATRRMVCGEQLENFTARLDRSQPGNCGLSANRPVNAVTPTVALAADRVTAVTAHRCQQVMSLNTEGEQAFKDGDLDLAQARFKQAYALVPNNIEVLNNLVVLHWHKQDLVSTVNTLLEALQLDPCNRDVVVNGGQILVALNKENDARNLYSSYLEQNPDDVEVSRLLSTVGSAESGHDCSSHTPASAIGDFDESAGRLPARFVDYAGSAEAPRISVVIPSFNQGAFLEETICSILDQAYPNLELIVMDGGSTDQSIDIIKKYEGSISYWQSRPDRGQYWAIDTGLRRSSGGIMTWINSDDKLQPNSLNAVASIFSQFKEVDWVTGTPSVMNGKGQLAWVCSPPPVYSREYYLARKYDYPNYIQQEGTFWRRSLWEKAGGRLKTSLKMAGDLELWMRFFRHSRLYTTDMLLGCFRQHSGQKTDGGLQRYRTEALRELDKEIARFKKSQQKLPERAPIIMIADQVSLSRKPQRGDKSGGVARGKNDEVLVTAIVSTYNSEKYIAGCLQNLMSQTIADRLEVIVVDSGSQQNERGVVERYQKEYPNIRYLRTDTRETIYAAWNRAIAVARGRYLSNANTDDRHRTDAYERMVAELEMDPDVSLVYADSAVTRLPNAGFGRAPIEGVFRWPDFDARHLFAVCYIGPQPMWRRSVHEKYGDFDAQMTVAGDYDFWLRMATAETFRHIPEVLGLYLLSSGSLEHAFPAAGAAESQAARQRNWPDAWGQRPALSPGYLVPADQLADVRQGEHTAAPLISIIMPTKDRLPLLGRALDSVLAQTYSNWELIVVNDGGESIHAVTADRDPCDRIRCIDFDRSQAQAVARNTALTAAKGEIICYLDDDDVYLPHHLETVVRGLSGQEHAFVYTDAVVVKERLVDGSGEEVDRSNPYAHHDYSRERLLVNNYIPINTWAHKRVCVDAVGLFDRSLSCYEDWEFLLRLSERYDFHHIEKTTVEVRHRVDQVDNVSRIRLADTADAYRRIYARHGKGLAEDLLAERETVVRALTSNIDSWVSAGDNSDTIGAETASGADAASVQATAENSYQKWQLRHALADRDIARISKHMMTDWTIQPSVHLIMTHRSGQEEALADTLDTLDAQLYGGWGLSVVSCSPCPDPIFEDMDMLEWRQVGEDLMQAVNAVAVGSAADWIGLLDVGCKLEPHLLYRHVDSLHQHPEWRLVYMDEDRIGSGGERYDPLFKPEFNLELLRAMPYMGRFLLLEREALIAVGGYSQDPGTEAYDIVFRFAEQFGAEVIGHIPDVLLHQQDRFQLAYNEQAIPEHQRQCVVAHLQRCAIAADVQPGVVSGSHFIDYGGNDRPPVDIVVPVSGSPGSLGLFLDSLSSMTDYPDFRLRLLIREDVKLPAELLSKQCCDVRSYSKTESQWQKLLELVRESDKEYVLLMSPASIAIQPKWLDRLVVQLQNKDVALVAPRLISSDNKIVGGGLILGAGPCSIGMVAFGGLSLDEPGYMGRAQVAQEVSAVSASCMLVRKSTLALLEEGAGDLKIPLYQAVDYCLRVRAAGGKVIWTPHSTLLYLGGDQAALDGEKIDEIVTRESEAVCAHTLARLAHDPAYNPNLSLAGERFSVDDSFSPHLTHDNDSLHRVVGLGAGSIGSWEFRIQQPLQVMHGDGVTDSLILPFSKHPVQLPSLAELERLQVNSLLMHNTMHDSYMDAMEAFKRLNQTFIVFGQDDLMYAMPPKNPFSKTIYKDVKKRLRRCLGIADRVVVTTQALADELSSMADDIQVVPNYLDEAIWAGLQSQRGVAQKPRVGWAGAQQHLGDLELLEEVVRETADEVDWVFFGMCPQFLQPYAKEIHDPVTFGEYPQKLATLNLDLAVAPLEHNRFNECKSNLRLLEYGALGWPVIASDIAPYREGPVCRVHNQARAWIKAIRERIHDLDASRREGDVLRDWVRENWLLQQHLHDWLAALDPASDSRQRHSTQGRAAGL
jgi:glycosyltransferase involved in cell wall biosynthesis